MIVISDDGRLGHLFLVCDNGPACVLAAVKDVQLLALLFACALHDKPAVGFVDVLGAVAAAEKVAHHRTHNLAVLVAHRHAAAAKILIYRALDGLNRSLIF